MDIVVVLVVLVVVVVVVVILGLLFFVRNIFISRETVSSVAIWATEENRLIVYPLMASFSDSVLDHLNVTSFSFSEMFIFSVSERY
jgi:hypothetical protein